MNARQIGKFKVSGRLLNDNVDLVAALFKKMDLIVIRAEARWDLPEIDYVGISSLFEEIPLGQEPPEYDIVCISSHENYVNTVNYEGYSPRIANVSEVRAEKKQPMIPSQPHRLIEIVVDDL